MIKEYYNWGNTFTVEFELTVKKLPDTVKNVFIFESSKRALALGLYVKDDGIGSFYVCNGNQISDCEDIGYGFGLHRISIKQYWESGEYWYEVITDGLSKIKTINTKPRMYPNVKLYASDPFAKPFNSTFGSICNVAISEGKNLCI